MKVLVFPCYRFSLALKKAIPRRLLDRQKPREKVFTLEDKIIQYNPFQALQLIRAHTFTSFTESIDVCIQLGVNPKHGDQIVRGSAFMPAGLGKSTRVAALCSPTLKQQMKDYGVDKFIDEQGLSQIKAGKTQFDMLFATPDLVGHLKPFGKILGPRGLMPNAKIGTLVSEKEFANAIKRAKAGQVNYRVDNGKNIHAPLGKITFKDEDILLNFKSLMQSLVQKKPQGLKGKYFVSAFIKSTMGPRWKLSIDEIDPRSVKSIWDVVN